MYSVGIDLGTTNSAIAEVDLSIEPASPGGPLPAPIPMEVPQLVGPGETAARELLPSFVYLPAAVEKLGANVVGQFARERGAQVPGRLVSSSKSWLSRGSQQLLPVTAEPDVARISPLEAGARILAALRDAWDAAHEFENQKLADQAVTLTVPASFDAVARELTVQAAKQAGLQHLTLLEEPQAALYAWVSAGDKWRQQVHPGDVILVVDVGGGTSDFSLISVGETGGDGSAGDGQSPQGQSIESGALTLERVAVGDHILLGGDNVDLALAHAVNESLKVAGTKLDAWQFAALTHACRRAKENRETEVVIPGRGSGLVGGTIRAELPADVLRDTVDAFFPEVPRDAQPLSQRRMGLTTIGLPYAQDPAVTRHLAAFLKRAGQHPTAILFNGGVFKDTSLQERVAALVDSWTGQKLKRLESLSLDLAVAVGASYSGLARKGRGIRIRGGTARAYYVGVESAAPAVPGFAPPLRAVCLAPFGMEEGSTVDLPQLEVGAVVGEVASFRFFASGARPDDVAGTTVDDIEELDELAPIETTLTGEAGTVKPVHLRAHVSEVGTLELQLVAHDGQAWKMEFSVRHDGGVGSAGDGRSPQGGA
jgi:molecular chaperone DnaK (HSP70)